MSRPDEYPQTPGQPYVPGQYQPSEQPYADPYAQPADGATQRPGQQQPDPYAPPATPGAGEQDSPWWASTTQPPAGEPAPPTTSTMPGTPVGEGTGWPPPAPGSTDPAGPPSPFGPPGPGGPGGPAGPGGPGGPGGPTGGPPAPKSKRKLWLLLGIIGGVVVLAIIAGAVFFVLNGGLDSLTGGGKPVDKPAPKASASPTAAAAGGKQFKDVPIEIDKSVSAATMKQLEMSGTGDRANKTCNTTPPKTVDAAKVTAKGCEWEFIVEGKTVPGVRHLEVRAAAYKEGSAGAAAYVTGVKGKIKNAKAAPELGENAYLGSDGLSEVAVFQNGNLIVLVKYADTSADKKVQSTQSRQRALTVAKEIKAAIK